MIVHHLLLALLFTLIYAGFLFVLLLATLPDDREPGDWDAEAVADWDREFAELWIEMEMN